MTNSRLEIALAVFFIGGGLVWGWLATRKSERRATAGFRTRAHAQFKNSRVDSVDARYAFCGHSVRVVTERQRRHSREGWTTDVVLERYCVNDSGEYFHFISNSGGQAYIRHVPHHLVRLVLKDKYVPPADA